MRSQFELLLDCETTRFPSGCNPCGDRTSQSASQIALAISLDFFTRVISNLFDGYGISKQTDNGYRWEVHERKPNANGVDQILTSLFSILAGYAVANH
jgi:hypothetical protein